MTIREAMRYGKEQLIVKTATIADGKTALIVFFERKTEDDKLVPAFYGAYRTSPYEKAGVDAVLADVSACYIAFNEMAGREGYDAAVEHLETHSSYQSPFTGDKKMKDGFKMLLALLDLIPEAVDHFDTSYTIYPAVYKKEDGTVTPTYIPMTADTPHPGCDGTVN